MLILSNRSARRKALRGLRSLRNDVTGLAEVKDALKGFQEAQNARDTKLQGLIDQAMTEIAKNGQMGGELKNAIEKTIKDGEAVQARMVAMEQALANIKTTNAPATVSTPGSRFTDDAEIKEKLLKQGNKFRGRISTTVNTVTSLTSGSGGAGDLIVPQRQPGIVTAPNRRLRIRDLLPKGRTVSNAIEYVKESGYTNAAAPVAEGTSKPESTLSFEIANAPVRTIAHWLRATKQILDDVPQLQSYIDTRLRYGLELVEEAELLAGDGTGEHILGLIPQATAYDTTRSRVGDTRIDIVRRAMTQLRISEYSASAIILHPTDWEEIELTKDKDDNYIWANPRGLVGPTLWGLPVLDSTSLEEGEFLVGAFDVAAQLWDRENATVEVSTEDADNFTKNLVTIRAEERLALTVYREESFIYGDFDQDVST